MAIYNITVGTKNMGTGVLWVIFFQSHKTTIKLSFSQIALLYLSFGHNSLVAYLQIV